MVAGHKPQVDASVYDAHAFDPLRIESITEQLRWLSRLGGGAILEVGIGKGFLRQCLRLFPEVEHTTVDIAADLRPDHVASVTEMPFQAAQFDIVVCCEVLEHMPFADFIPALREIRRVARRYVVLSLPDRRRSFGVALRLARFGWRQLEWNPPRRRDANRPLPFTGEHYWEIGCRGTLIRDVRRGIRQAGFRIEREYRLHGHAWHTFFVLR